MSRGPRRSHSTRSPLTLRGAIGGGVLLLVLLALAGFLFVYAGPGPRAAQGASTDVVLDHGAGVRGIARTLKHAQVIRTEAVFLAMAKLTGGRGLKAGEYLIPSGESMAGILSDIRAGRVVRHFITIPEGWTSEMAANAVNASPFLTGFAPTPPE
ncbi:MAG: endolytic transglycosylase MltG, partial [Alphaproteobacteria bacterium]|nr:endolytic transglycosylase MltG [Alphaproteobacteria bacterium]